MRKRMKPVPVGLLMITAIALIAWLAVRTPQVGSAPDLDAAMVEPQTPATGNSSLVSDHSTRGEIVSVTGRVIRLRSDGLNEDFVVPEEATIIKNKRPAAFDAILAGDIAKITHSDAKMTDDEVVITLRAWSAR